MSFSLTKHSEQCLPMMSGIPSMTSTRVTPYSSPWSEEWELAYKQDDSINPRGPVEDPRRFAGVSMLVKTTSGVPSCTFANDAGATTEGLTVPNLMKKRERVENWRSTVRNPRYLRGYVWGIDLGLDTPSVSSTLHRDPLLGVPINDYKHDLVTQTINNNLHLFKIVTPIQSDALSNLLLSHPNRKFVDSVVQGFKSGFWPSTNANKLQVLPKGLDN